MSEQCCSGDGQTDQTSAVTAREQREAVRRRYGEIAEGGASSCCGTDSSDSCCGDTTTLTEQTQQLGYSAHEATAAPSGANMGLGCGNPTAIASLDVGETVLDLGSGGGFDCFLAAQAVGDEGTVIGVDMTPEMIEKARKNAEQHEYSNTEFRLGEIEQLPVADESVDVIISNCVINLSPDKSRVFEEAFRVLRPGGRLAVSDVVMTAEIPDEARADPDEIARCIAGAATINMLETMLGEAGFRDVQIQPKEASREFIRDWDADRDLSEYLASATIEARIPVQPRESYQETDIIENSV